MKIEGIPVERRLVDLVVAGVHDDAARRGDRQRRAVGHAVRHPDELDLERSDRHPVARANDRQPLLGLLDCFTGAARCLP